MKKARGFLGWGLVLTLMCGFTPDLTPEFREDFETLKTEKLRTSEVEKIRYSYRVLLVPGIISDMVGDHEGLFRTHFGVEGYFRTQKEFFSLPQIGIAHKVVDIDSQQGALHNAEILRQEILLSQVPVILIGHSKGGVDILTALIRWPELQEKVALFITWQSPLLGSPTADSIHQNAILFGLVERLLKLHHGAADMLLDLTQRERIRYFDVHRTEIEALARRVPIIHLGTWVEADLYTLFSRTRDYLLSLGLPNDGAVPLASASLPVEVRGVIELPGVDHGATVLSEKYIEFDRVAFTKAFVRLMARELPEQPVVPYFPLGRGNSAQNR